MTKTHDTAFWDSIARKYATQPIADTSAYETTLNRVRQHLGAEDTVLELGCGTGSTALLLADGVARYTGTDVSPEMIAIANEKRAAEPITGLDFVTADSSAEAFDAGAFDAVLAFNLYHLVARPNRAMARVHSLLKPGGIFISKTPCLAKRWYLRPVIFAMHLVGKAPRTVHMFGVEEYDAMIRRAGFEIVETGLYPPKTPSRFVVARKV